MRHQQLQFSKIVIVDFLFFIELSRRITKFNARVDIHIHLLFFQFMCDILNKNI